ncbi:MAG: hypothetical protein HC903_06255 [Methylacidiphilales bacterium]|nr:hypothetical protein [Candidatus Methylacidiphilales bacterium]NJR19168.1 hypothetical protein [Calothrix sp. CSU_2_0]
MLGMPQIVESSQAKTCVRANGMEAGLQETVQSLGIIAQRAITHNADQRLAIVIVIAATAKDTVLGIFHNKNCMIQKSGNSE